MRWDTLSESRMLDDLLERIHRHPDKCISVAYRNLDSGLEWFVQPDRVYHAASTMKIGVMMEAFRQASEGRFALSDLWTLTNRFESIADGSPYSLNSSDDSDPELYLRVGEQVSVLELIERMIRKSGNLATNEIISRVGAARVQSFMDELGAPDLVIRRGVEDYAAYAQGLNNTATARGLCEILSRLGREEVVSRTASLAMIEVLLGQEHNEGIPVGLMPGMRAAHKTGWIGEFYHDAGLVYSEADGLFVLVFLTEGFADMVAGGAFVAEATNALLRD